MCGQIETDSILVLQTNQFPFINFCFAQKLKQSKAKQISKGWAQKLKWKLINGITTSEEGKGSTHSLEGTTATAKRHLGYYH